MPTSCELSKEGICLCGDTGNQNSKAYLRIDPNNAGSASKPPTLALYANTAGTAHANLAATDITAAAITASGDITAASLTTHGDITAETGTITANDITALGTMTVHNLNIQDKCVVYGLGATKNETMSLLFKKSGSTYAGIVRAPGAGGNAGSFKFIDDGATIGGADPTDIDTSATITYATCVADKYTCESDQRLKENVVPIDGALEKVGAMRGVYYDWIDKAKGSARQIGVIAQEVQAACPELVDASDAYLTVDYARIAAVLIEAVKDLTARVAALEARAA